MANSIPSSNPGRRRSQFLLILFIIRFGSRLRGESVVNLPRVSFRGAQQRILQLYSLWKISISKKWRLRRFVFKTWRFADKLRIILSSSKYINLFPENLGRSFVEFLVGILECQNVSFCIIQKWFQVDNQQGRLLLTAVCPWLGRNPKMTVIVSSLLESWAVLNLYFPRADY